jgi:3-dehydroquinate dehydratase-2
MNLLIVNGPNLNMLGKREPEVYGNEHFDDVLSDLRSRFPQVRFGYYQSNSEGALIDAIQDADGKYAGVVLNPGAYGHTSIALADCIAAVQIPVVEVHISNVFNRESFRANLILAPVTQAFISGAGVRGYALAVEFFLNA